MTLSQMRLYSVELSTTCDDDELGRMTGQSDQSMQNVGPVHTAENEPNLL